MDMSPISESENKIHEAKHWIESRVRAAPKAGIILGTGLGQSMESFGPETAFDYEQIPHFPKSSVVSHAGRLLSGTLKNVPVLVFQGRCHLYEGYCPEEVVFPVRLLKALGAGTLIMANAVGGLNLDFDTGDIMAIQDHINLTGANPLVGPESPGQGPRFPSMHQAYDPGLWRLAQRAGHDLGIHVREGVYAGLLGPSLETPAEMRFLRTIGADCVGFSTVLETIAAVQAGIKVLGLAAITNMNVSGRHPPCSVEDILKAADKAAPDLGAIIGYVLADLGRSL